jgi:tRNA G10  N-methylase Trm11
MNRTSYFLKLRSNIVLEGDVDLAEREARAFFENVERVDSPIAVESKIGLSSAYSSLHSRTDGCIGFIACGTALSVPELVRLLNFIQEVWFETSDHSRSPLLEKERWAYSVRDGVRNFICLLPLMACGELLSQTKMESPRASDIKYLTAYLAGDTSICRMAFKAPTSGRTSTQHVHSLHKYKAKFFPRLIRSFLVRYMEVLPRNSEGKVTLLDPFVGSGTALIEAMLLGIDSSGVDIDKLSCAISQAKICALMDCPEEVTNAAKELNKAVSGAFVDYPTYKFPRRIARKFGRWGNLEEQIEYERTITKWQSAIDKLQNDDTRLLFRICLSDALIRKFVIRMMGTGVGRFALEIAKTPLDTLMASNLKSLIHGIFVAQSLIEGYGINVGKAAVHHGTAVKLPLDDQSFSIIVTSPPYLPASSGREDYLLGKAISSVALNLMTDDEIELAETASVGSMKWVIEEGDGLPKAVYELHDWLLKDPLREIKAKPILAYYLSLKQSLHEARRVLMPNGFAIYVIGKESVFYRFSTREVLYRVGCDKIFAQMAESCGFVIEEQIDVELDKKNKNARPRSLDSFFETVFVLRKRI